MSQMRSTRGGACGGKVRLTAARAVRTRTGHASPIAHTARRRSHCSPRPAAVGTAGWGMRVRVCVSGARWRECVGCFTHIAWYPCLRARACAARGARRAAARVHLRPVGRGGRGAAQPHGAALPVGWLAAPRSARSLRGGQRLGQPGTLSPANVERPRRRPQAVAALAARRSLLLGAPPTRVAPPPWGGARWRRRRGSPHASADRVHAACGGCAICAAPVGARYTQPGRDGRRCDAIYCSPNIDRARSAGWVRNHTRRRPCVGARFGTCFACPP
eukprot:1856552-Prymnesium_polylepis.1